jgi:enoyl-CoA hydratase
MSPVTTQRDDTVATITLHNPGKLNAISVAMWRALRETAAELAGDRSVRCVVIRGADGNFAAGADIEEFAQVRGSIPALHEYHREIIAPTLRALAEFPHPLVALIEGVCVGGGLEIASQCDLRIAAGSSRFGVPINKLGFPMAPDEMRALLAVVGHATAAEILLEGRIFGAAEAKEKGLLTRVVPDAEVVGEAYAAAARIAAAAPLAQRLNKRLLRRLRFEAAPLTDAEWDESFAYGDSHDHREGVAAFLEKRKPRFRGD